MKLKDEKASKRQKDINKKNATISSENVHVCFLIFPCLVQTYH